MSTDPAKSDKAALSKTKLAETLLEIGSLSRSDLKNDGTSILAYQHLDTSAAN